MIYLLPIVGGIGCSLLMLYFAGIDILEETSLFGSALFAELDSVEYKKGVYLFYLIKTRGLQVGFVAVMSYIHRKEWGTFIWAWLTGMGFGIGLYAMLQQYGSLGFVGYMMIIFPHYLCYIFAYMQYVKIDSHSQKIRAKSYGRNEKTGKGWGIFGVVIIGILLECYVNPFFLKFFSKIFL